MSDLSFLSDYVVLNLASGSNPFTGLTLLDLLALMGREDFNVHGYFDLYKPHDDDWRISNPPSIDWRNPLDKEDDTLVPKLVHKSKLNETVVGLYEDCFDLETAHYIKRRKALRRFLLDNGTSEDDLRPLEHQCMSQLKGLVIYTLSMVKQEIADLKNDSQKYQTLLDACNAYFEEG